MHNRQNYSVKCKLFSACRDGISSDSLTLLLPLLLLCRMLLQHCLRQQRSTQVAVVHCSAQTSPSHVLQKLGQMCMVISSNTGRVYRPKDCDRLVLYLKDLNLPKPDKWGTSQLIAFLHQVLFSTTFLLDGFVFLGNIITVYWYWHLMSSVNVQHPSIRSLYMKME